MERQLNRRWWSEEAGDVHGTLFATLRVVDEEQSTRSSNNRVTSRLYGDELRPYTYLTSPGVPLINPVVNPAAQRAAWGSITYNLCRVAADALASKIAKSRPKPSFITDGGTWAQQRRAKRLDEFVYGTFHAAKLFDIGRRNFLDGCQKDTGFVKGFLRGGKICLERVQPEEVLVGAMDSLYNKPRSMYHVTLVARDEVLSWIDEWHSDKSAEQREKLKKTVMEASSGVTQQAHWAAMYSHGDVVLVAEAWHLPSKAGAKDGRHVVCVDTADVLDERWKSPRFPLATFRFHERNAGFYGQGLVELLMSRQQALNSLCRTITDSLRLMSVPRYFVKSGAQFATEQLTNEPGIIMRGLEPPQILSGNVVPAELFSVYERTIREGLESVGISQLSVAGLKPAGLNSAPALREQTDIESDRFSLVTLQYEGLFMEAGQLVVDLARQAAQSRVKLKATSETRDGLKTIDWSEAELDEENYVLKLHSSSQLPQTPAARKEYVAELVDRGWIDPVEARRLLDMPDLEANFSIDMAGRDELDWLVEKFLDADSNEGAEEDYEPPERFQDLEYGIRRMQLEYLRAKRLGAPPARRELLLRWITQAAALLQPPPEQPPEPGLPPAEGTAPSVPPQPQA